MERLSQSMFFYKRVFPAIWFGFIGFVVVLGTVSSAASKHGPEIPAIVLILTAALFMAVLGYIIMKKLVFDLVDEVYDDGSSLLLRNGTKEARINLTDIKNVSYATMMSPPRVTLSLRIDTVFGKEVSFSPRGTRFLYKKSPLIEELIDRIDSARGGDGG